MECEAPPRRLEVASLRTPRGPRCPERPAMRDRWRRRPQLESLESMTLLSSATTIAHAAAHWVVAPMISPCAEASVSGLALLNGTAHGTFFAHGPSPTSGTIYSLFASGKVAPVGSTLLVGGFQTRGSSPATGRRGPSSSRPPGQPLPPPVRDAGPDRLGAGGQPVSLHVPGRDRLGGLQERQRLRDRRDHTPADQQEHPRTARVESRILRQLHPDVPVQPRADRLSTRS